MTLSDFANAHIYPRVPCMHTPLSAFYCLQSLMLPRDRFHRSAALLPEHNAQVCSAPSKCFLVLPKIILAVIEAKMITVARRKAHSKYHLVNGIEWDRNIDMKKWGSVATATSSTQNQTTSWKVKF